MCHIGLTRWLPRPVLKCQLAGKVNGNDSVMDAIWALEAMTQSCASMPAQPRRGARGDPLRRMPLEDVVLLWELMGGLADLDADPRASGGSSGSGGGNSG